MYLTALIDVYSRYTVGWGLDVSCSLGVVKKVIKQYGKPEILNSDQGGRCQFTCKSYIDYVRVRKLI